VTTLARSIRLFCHLERIRQSGSDRDISCCSSAKNQRFLDGARNDATYNIGHDVVVASNDNWKVDDQSQQSQQAAITATGKAPPHDSESAILRTMAPGNYTAILKGKNNTTGIALLEVYNVP